MPDDLTNPGPEDGKLIALNEPWEVTYWTNVLSVTEQQLRDAVEAVGNSAAYVRDHLGIATN